MNRFDADQSVAIVGALMALLIVAGAARGHRLTFRSGLLMLVIWAVVIAAVAALFVAIGRAASTA